MRTEESTPIAEADRGAMRARAHVATVPFVNAPGHLAVAYFVSSSNDRVLWPTALGAMVPDLLDKSVQWVGITPYGRTLGHSVFLWLVLVLVWIAARARLRWLGWLVLGGISHLIVDLVDDVVEGLQYTGYVFSGWFAWPLTNPDMWNVPTPHLFPRVVNAFTALELATVAACICHAVLASRPR